jgi:hypothetical protein
VFDVDIKRDSKTASGEESYRISVSMLKRTFQMKHAKLFDKHRPTA